MPDLTLADIPAADTWPAYPAYPSYDDEPRIGMITTLVNAYAALDALRVDLRNLPPAAAVASARLLIPALANAAQSLVNYASRSHWSGATNDATTGLSSVATEAHRHLDDPDLTPEGLILLMDQVATGFMTLCQHLDGEFVQYNAIPRLGEWRAT